MSYVDGFVLTVTKDRMGEYKKLAELAGKIWMSHGALSYVECIAEDIEDKGFCKTFPQLAQPNEGEIVIFSYITFKSRAHRDEVNSKVHSDPELSNSCDPNNLPFDCKRMTYGGFETLVAY